MKFSQLIVVAAIATSLGLTGCNDDGGGNSAAAPDTPTPAPTPTPTPTPDDKTFTVSDGAVPIGAQKKDFALPDDLKGLLVDSAEGPELPSYAGFGIPVPDKFLSAQSGAPSRAFHRATVQPAVVYAGSSMAMKTVNADVSTLAQRLLNDMKTYLGQGTLASGGFDILANQSIQGPQGVIAVRLVDLELTAQQTVASLRQSLIDHIIGRSQGGLPTIAMAQTKDFQLTLAVFLAGNQAYMWLGVYPESQQDKASVYSGLSNGTALTVSSRSTRKNNTDQFNQQTAGAADLLLVIDNSGSMSEEQTNVADTAGLLFSKLNNASLNYHLGVARTGYQSEPGPCYELSQTSTGARFIEPATPNGATEFEDISQPGTGGSADETGLFCAEQTFVDAGGVNGDFDRAGAPNVVLILSDEPEHETVDKELPGNAPTGYTQQDLTHYVTYFTQTNPATVFTIVGTSAQTRMTFSDPEPSSSSDPDYRCSGPGGNASGGANYGAISQATGGSRASICVGSANYGTLMNRLVATATGLGSQFELAEVPIAGTVKVKINGQSVTHDPGHTNGFDVIYSINGAAIVFYGRAIPRSGNTITVTYKYVA